METPKSNPSKRPTGGTSRTLIGSALAVTSFMAVASPTGLTAHVTRSLDRAFQPLATSATSQFAISDPETSHRVGGRELKIIDRTAWLVGENGERRLAPDGFYRLSDEQTLWVRDGRVYAPMMAKQPPQWKLICIKGSWSQACAVPVPEGEAMAKVDVQDVWNRIQG